MKLEFEHVCHSNDISAFAKIGKQLRFSSKRYPVPLNIGTIKIIIISSSIGT
jgi:hypothetical protein